MTNIKKAVVLILAILAILIFTNNTFASTIQPRNDTGNTSENNSNNSSVSPANNSSTNATNNSSRNSSNNSANNVSNNGSNSVMGGTNNVSTPINTTNTSQNLPNTGIDPTYLNFALILILTLVLGMFSLVQYNKIIKKDNEE